MITIRDRPIFIMKEDTPIDSTFCIFVYFFTIKLNNNKLIDVKTKSIFINLITGLVVSNLMSSTRVYRYLENKVFRTISKELKIRGLSSRHCGWFL